MKKKIIIKKDHIKNCFIAYTEDEMYLMTKEFYGNFAGNKTKNGCYNRWIEMSCNNPQCNFKAIINQDILSELIIRKMNTSKTN